MTSRPSFSNKRPLSAIFLGSNSSSSNIPDLPEPPSPSASSNDSGLPSPPATNSTGSGSVGDSNSNNAGSVRHRPSPSHSTMLNGNHHARHISSSSVLDDVQDENENGDEEQTAKFGAGRRYSASGPAPDNITALERVKSLAKRNQEALAKLTRLNSPPPVHGRSNVLSRSPMLPPSGASFVSHTRVVSQPPSTEPRRESTHSGSETERENYHASSSDDRAATPPASIPHSHIRQRLISAPESPSKFRTRDRDRQNSPPGQPRNRPVPLRSLLDQSVNYEGDDVTGAALAAVASSRRSPTDRRTRQPLPREFREKDRSVDGQSAGEPSTLATPHRNRSIKIIEPRRSQSPSRGSVFNTPVSPHPARATLRSSTLRDVTRGKTMRSASDDISHAYDEEPSSRIRRQSLRGGSAESPLANNRSLVGEGLRAAGIMRRRETHDDVFQEPFREPEESKRSQSSARGNLAHNGDWDESRDSDQARQRVHKRSSLSMARLSEVAGSSSDIEPRTPASASSRQPPRVNSRPATSMAGYHYEESPDSHRVSMLRADKSPTPFPDRDQDQVSQTSASRQQAPPHERGYVSPYGISRQLAGTPLSAQRERVSAGDHGKLMFDSLSIFESHLSRLPPMGNTTTTTIPELFRSAQSIIQATDRLNALLRNGTNKALEEQIGAEVSGELGEGNVEMSEHWRSVGSDFRDSLRVSDELVRNMTGFLLGVGKVLRETSSSMNSQQQHMRSMSLDESSVEVARTAGGRSSEGRSATGSRRSWDLVRREPEHRALSREGANSSRPPSSFRDRRIEETPPTASTQSSTSSSSARRFLTSRERDSPVSAVPTPTLSRKAILDFQASLNEPSPTPASRQQPRGPPPLVVPRPLPFLPAVLMDRQGSDSESGNRKKMSTNSTATVRAGSSFLPAVTTSSATTAITHHTVSSPHMSRESSDSAQRAGFSRPSAISFSALNGLKQRESRSRLPSSNFSSSEEQSSPSTANIQTHVSSPLPGSDRERESRWRTVGPRTTRMSLDGADRGDNGADQPEVQTMRLPSSSRRERRRTITEIFSGS